MVYRKKRVSRIKSKRSGSKSYNLRRSRTKSRRRVKRTQMKGKFKKRLFLKGGAGKSQEITLERVSQAIPWGFKMSKTTHLITEVSNGSPTADAGIIRGQIITHINNTAITTSGVTDDLKDDMAITLTIRTPDYLNMATSSPILDSIITSDATIYKILTILEFIHDTKNFYIKSLYCKLGTRQANICDYKAQPIDLYGTIFGKVFDNHDYLFEARMMNQKKEDPAYFDGSNIIKTDSREIADKIWYILKTYINKLLQLELLAFLTNNIPFLNKLLDSILNISHIEILRNIKIEKILTFCGDFMPHNKIITTLEEKTDINLFDYLQDLKKNSM